MANSIFTIGHSNHTVETFLDLLKKHQITALCDVRSQPYSRFYTQFNRENLKTALRENGISYVYLGKELGARSDDPNCYIDGKVQFDLLAQTDLFKQGLRRINEGASKYQIALMCAEKDPLECHRTILVSRHVEESLGITVSHILPNGALESHTEALDRLLRELKLPAFDIFRTAEMMRSEAYQKRGQKIAYTSDDIAQQDRDEIRVLPA